MQTIIRKTPPLLKSARLLPQIARSTSQTFKNSLGSYGARSGIEATMNLRTDEKGKAIKEGSQVEIGGNERSVSMCRTHFREGMREKFRPVSVKMFLKM